MNRRLAIILLLCSSAATAMASGTDDVQRGKQLYVSRCAFCHGDTGKGDGPAGVALNPAPRSFATAEYWKATDPEAIRTVIENGKPNTAMVPFKSALTAAEIDDVITYMKTFEPAP